MKPIFCSSKALFAIAFAFTITACGGEKERPEVIAKLRGLGVEQTPVNASPGSTVEVIFHLAAASGLTLNATPFLDTASKYGPAALVTLIDKTATETKLNNASHYKLRAQLVIPSTPEVNALTLVQGLARVRFGVKLTSSTDGDDETIVADALVYKAGSEQLTWKAPTIEIAEPVLDSISNSTTLGANIQSTGSEKNRVGWFVTNGKVKNPAAKSSVWSEIPAGDQTLFLTVRGTKSGAFSIKTKTVKVN